MEIVVRLDYATVNFAPGTMSYTKVGKILLGDDLRWRSRGLSENAPLVSPMGLRWLENNGYAELPHKLEVSGVGCTHFALTLPDLVSAAEHRFSRLDFAFDVLISRAAWRAFICRAFEASLSSDRQRKCFRLSGQGEAMTIYIGSRKSPRFFRIYNKTLEDAKYRYFEDGVEKSVPDDMCVIRYEVELKRHKFSGVNDLRVFDPSPAFTWYYGDERQQQQLTDEIRKMWLSFGDDVLLPDGFADAEFTVMQHNANFVQSSAAERLEEVREKLHDFPHSFDHTLQYLVDKFAKYIPYIVADRDYMQRCHDECEFAFGFVPEYYLEQSLPSGWYDLDETSSCEVTDLPWAYEQLELSQLPIDESEV